MRVKPSTIIYQILGALLLATDLALSLYLYARSILLLNGNSGNVVNICAAAFKTDCDATLLSDEAVFLGMPLAGWGLVYFGGLVTVLLLGYLIGEGFKHQAIAGALLAVAVGVVISIVLLGTFAFGTVPVCPLCVLIHVINILLFFTLFKSSGQSPRALLASVGVAIGFIVGHASTEELLNSNWRALGFATSLLSASAIYFAAFGYYARTDLEAELTPRGQDILMSYLLMPRQEVPIDVDDARTMSSGPAVEIVVFSDFQCVGCYQFVDTIDQIRDTFPDFVTLVYKHFPINSECNPSVAGSLHPLSCEIATLSEIARRQGNFWPFHDAMHALDRLPDRAVVDELASRFNLRLEDAIPEDSERIQRHINEALALGVEGTPAVFVNGRRVLNPSKKTMDMLIWHQFGLELERT